MKRIMLIVVTAVFMFTYVPMAGAWTVYFRNISDHDVKVKVWGEHLFWQQVDCEITVAVGKEGSCQLPGGVCPVWIGGSYKNSGRWTPELKGNESSLNKIDCGGGGVACCWNVKVLVGTNGGASWLSLDR